jgi:hypothetical protein
LPAKEVFSNERWQAIPHTLEIKWKDRHFAEGGGTELLVKVDGKEQHNQAHSDVEDARRVATRYVQAAKFDNVASQSSKV